ncbi:hypothetical protein BR93DRAFT_971590 [Coniochaeta sp. PMI_546]|nr:hypothetical protein BR93DRAFT_971590 [Coniochaeta sp. PMI_546]
MDPSGSADNPIENLKPFNLMRFPEEIVCMIFREFLSKPAIHYADFKFAFPRHVVGRLHAGDIIIMVLREWAQYDIKSGYVSSDTLARTCRLARDVALSTIIEPSRIRFENVHKVVDASTDVLCLVHPPFQNVQQFERGISPDWEPKLDAGQVGSSLGNIRRAGLRVSQEIWCNLLENWFLVTESIVRNGFDYQYRDGHLHRSHLGVLMSCFSDLQAFYLILTNVTEDDWNTYYAGEYWKSG